MAKVKFSALVSEMRNKLNGSVFSKNRAGNYLRNKVTPVNPQTIAQVAARNRLSSWSQAFRGLTAAQIASWNSAVEQFKTTDIFGDMKTPSGINLFTRLNINLDLVGGTNITTPPLPVTLGQIEGLALVSDVSSSTVTLTWTSGAVPANTAWLIEATPCISAGKSFVKSEYRLINVLATATTSGSNNFTSWSAKFGSLVAGQKLFVRVTPVSTTTGIKGLPIQVETVITV